MTKFGLTRFIAYFLYCPFLFNSCSSLRHPVRNICRKYFSRITRQLYKDLQQFLITNHHKEFHFGHSPSFSASVSGQKNDSLLLGISRCSGLAVTTHIKEQMFVDLNRFKTIFSTRDPSFTRQRKSSDETCHQ